MTRKTTRDFTLEFLKKYNDKWFSTTEIKRSIRPIMRTYSLKNSDKSLYTSHPSHTAVHKSLAIMKKRLIIEHRHRWEGHIRTNYWRLI